MVERCVMSIDMYNNLKGMVDGKTTVYIILGDTDIVGRRIRRVALLQEKVAYGIDIEGSIGAGVEGIGSDIIVSESERITIELDGDTIRTYSPSDIYLSYDDAKAELARRISATIDSLLASGANAGVSITLSERALSLFTAQASGKQLIYK